MFGRCILLAAQAMPPYRDILCQLDTGIGDGDHGVTIERGFLSINAAFQGDPGPGDGAFYRKIGDTLAASMGGAIGPIYGAYFQGLGAGLGDTGSIDAAALGRAMETAVSKVMRIAQVSAGQKTVVDAMLPAAQALTEGRYPSLSEGLLAACQAADQGAQNTKSMRAAKGRAKFLGERSIGFRDPGASSFALFLTELSRAVSEVEKE